MTSLFDWTGAALAALVVLAIAAARARVQNIAKFTLLNTTRRPVGSDGIVVGAGPINMDGNPRCAALLIHGFGDTPQSMRVLAESLHRAGWTVHVMLLPGHGRPLAEYAKSTAAEWEHAVRSKFDELRRSHQTIVLCGISMGAALATLLAADHPDIPALVLLAPYLAMPRRVYGQMLLGNLLAFPIPFHANSGGDQSIHDATARAQTRGTGVVSTRLLGQLRTVSLHAQRALPAVKTRVLYLQSREDNRLDAQDAIEQFARLGSKEKQQRWLSGCGHIITVDYCRDEVARQVIEWFAPALEPALQHHISET
ncbi:MAG: alpha/beta fold hydrolase [Phycisphaerae bacterium]|nr:alpha/beta fold hydrolase [Gemmatimonadaceae bacterium]